MIHYEASWDLILFLFFISPPSLPPLFHRFSLSFLIIPYSSNTQLIGVPNAIDDLSSVTTRFVDCVHIEDKERHKGHFYIYKIFSSNSRVTYPKSQKIAETTAGHIQLFVWGSYAHVYLEHIFIIEGREPDNIYLRV